MRRETGKSDVRGIALCLGVSLLLHAAAACAFALLCTPAKPRTTKARVRYVQVQREPTPAPKKEASAPAPADKPAADPPFAKTSPDIPEHRPERPDHVGKRNSRAASDPDSDGLTAPEDAPSMTGERKDELVTFDQDRQEGDLASDGRHDSPPEPPPPPAPTPEQTPAPPSGMAAGSPDSPAEAVEPAESTDAPTDTPAKPTPEEGIKLAEETTPAPPPPGTVEGGTATQTTDTPQPPLAPTVYRDPSLADHAQPGFRTEERRSRSAGRFVLGSHAALNVSATPRGRYEEEIYRRIAYWWYRACDEHRGDIIPGKIVISLRLDAKGRLVNMDLIQRSGASVIQQSFTFGAIRKASLPPMPDNVRSEMVGDLLEMIFEFNFN